MESYWTITQTGDGYYEEKKSRFISAAIPVATEQEMEEHLSRIKKKYYDAKHHCFACVLGEKGEWKRFSDDGEPQGTAGKPILAVLEGAGIRGGLIVVTRYFGGTLLGTGGLVRAYTAAAKDALQHAGPALMQAGKIVKITMDYSFLDKVNWYLKQKPILVIDTQYTDRVSIRVQIRKEDVPDLDAFLQNTGRNSIQVKTEEEGYYGFPA